MKIQPLTHLMSHSATAPASRPEEQLPIVVEVDPPEDETTIKPRHLATAVAAGTGALLTTGQVLATIASQTNPAAMVAAGALSLGCLAAGYVAADFGSAIFHWAIDNYPNGETPVLGSIADAFQAHHDELRDLEREHVTSNISGASAIFAGPLLAAALLNPGVALGSAAVGFCGGPILAQASHRYTHMNRPPGWVKALQGTVLQSKKDHLKHHRQPHAGHYGIVNGYSNPLLNRTHIFRHAERLVYQATGKEPNSWKDPNLKAFALGQISETEYLDPSNQRAGRKIFNQEIQKVYEEIYARRAAAAAGAK